MNTMHSFRASGLSDQGPRRPANQDRFVIREDDGVLLAAVMDGLGGEVGGEIASTLVKERLEGFDIHQDEAERMLPGELVAAGESILRLQDRKPDCRGMGSTATALLLRDGMAFWSHVGDSRLYLWRGGRLSQITTDHRFVQDFIDSGEMTLDEARNDPMWNHLDQALGTPDPEPDSGLLEACGGDVFLLCSDGLTDFLTDEDIASVLAAPPDERTLERRLVDRVYATLADDNITVVVVEYGPDPA